jgi:enterochelin esterase family protein
MISRTVFHGAWAALLATVFCSQAAGQQTDGERPAFRFPPPPVASPEVSDDGKVTFRIRAASADSVRLEGGDIPDLGAGGDMTKDAEGVWSHVVGPLPAGAYRYNFNVDGVRVIDPSNSSVSESNGAAWSLVVVSGSEVFDARDVPHGAVAEVYYQSKSLGRMRRMHVYTPPGYERGGDALPVLYLLHGALDCDDSWSTVGRAGFILDNLIAAQKAVPMIVVMPAGHTGPFQFGVPNVFERQMGEFVEDFTGSIRPYVEAHYRVRTDRASRAIAGLSMGGAQTLEIAMRGLGDYAYLGVFSSGVFGIDGRGPGGDGPPWEERHKAALGDAHAKEGLKLTWFATGTADFLINMSRETVKRLEAHGFDVTFKETEGGHTWLNWRDYLSEFAPLLFHAGA